MPYKYRLSQEAEWDVLDSYVWYEKQRPGLGEEFLQTLEAAQRAITANPTTYRIRYKNKVRAFVVNRFPYLILYIVAGKTLTSFRYSIPISTQNGGKSG
jgi:plasmid stabilization system protein ParE